MGPHGINPILFSIGSFEIRWYSLMYILSFIIGKQLLVYLTKHKIATLNKKQIDSLINYIIVGLIIGARLFDVLVYDLEHTLADPLSVLRIWEGFRGLSFHGGVIGITIALYLFAKKHKYGFFKLTDHIAFIGSLGLFFGRIGNFINSELYGRVTTSPFGVYFEGVEGLRHPSQIYEGIFEGLVIFAILRYFLFKKLYPGKLSALFLFFYGIFRFFIEFFREPTSFVGQLTMGQFLCLLMIPCAIFLFIYPEKKKLF
jgi:phosphatidylglycerol:prolipoprotein diacylglycerol transferase